MGTHTGLIAMVLLAGCSFCPTSAPAVHARSVVAAAVDCPEVYVEGDRGHYRAVGCGLSETFECTRDVAAVPATIQCARAESSEARSIRLRRWAFGADQAWRNPWVVQDSMGAHRAPRFSLSGAPISFGGTVVDVPSSPSAY